LRPLVILAGGRSSRMKKSLDDVNLSEVSRKQALERHKSLIELGSSKTPLLSLLCAEAIAAGIEKIIVVTNSDNQDFILWRKSFGETHPEVRIEFAIQPEPLGTADAVYQAMKQFTILQRSSFIIANGDNLYSQNAFGKALSHHDTPHAIISYEARYLGFDESRIAAFALIQVDNNNFVEGIIEKPPVHTHKNFYDKDGYLRVSMNLNLVEGGSFCKALQACPVHPTRGEKELPEAIRIAIKEQPKSVYCHLVFEQLPDLTSAQDLQQFS
jgi:dTDP-glucose pyrophosphorylase